MKTINAIHVDETDNCVTLTDHAGAGDVVCFLEGGCDRTVSARESIPKWHKMAINPIMKNGCVYKYGAVIGVASLDIEPGDHVHIHNIRSPVGAITNRPPLVPRPRRA